MINRILIVGLGSAGSRQLRIAKDKFADGDIRVFRHQKPDNQDFEEINILSTLSEVKEFKPQMAIICNPSSLHVEIAQFLAEERVHILIEKPISNSGVGVKKLIETSFAHSLILITGYNLRFLKSLELFRDSIQSGKVGNILSIRCEVGQYLPDWRPDKDYRSTVSAKKELGGGALLELSHEIDYLQWIFGDAIWVHAVITKQSNLEIDTEDYANLIIGFQGEALGKDLIGNLNLDLFRHDRTRSCFVIGDRGTIQWNGITDTVSTLFQGDDNWETIYQGECNLEETYVNQLDNFLESIEGTSAPKVRGIDGLRVIELIEAARISAYSAKKVEVNREYFESGN